MVLGRQGIAFRGHRDLASIFQFDNPDQSEGNFMAVLRDDELRKIREKCAKNATYTSPQIQNEIITACGVIIVQKIVDEVKKSKYFAILPMKQQTLAL